MKVCPQCACGSYGSPSNCPGCGTDLSEASDRSGTDLVGMVIEEKYELTDFIGEGAMGWVYKGRHRALDSTIAVKLMKPASEPDESRDKRFEREARAASRLNNPHIISIIDFGRTPGGVLFIISEFLRGDTLCELLDEVGPLPLKRALKIMDQVLSALDEAHSTDLVHRDMKPENIIITPLRSGEDFVKVLDFGIAKLAEPGSQRLTMQGQLFGTPAYMSPEQIRGQEVTPRSDLYACALMLYEMLSGEEPFQSESVMEVLSMQLHSEPEPLHTLVPERSLPPELEQVVMQGLSKRPEDRFASATEFREALHGAVRFQSQMLPVLSSVTCESCGHTISDGAKFCPECGSRQGTTSMEIGQVGRIAEGKAVQMTPSQDGLASVDGPRSRRQESPEIYSTLQRQLHKERTVSFELVGREQEMEALERLFQEPGGVAELLGPVGSGRSRVLKAAGEQAATRGLRVVATRADPQLSRAPWYPVQRLVRALLELADEPPSWEVLRQRTLSAGLVAEDVSGLAELFGLDRLDGEVEYAVRRRETYAAALRLLRHSRLAEGGLCVLFDDADEYDGATRTWIRDLVAGGAETGIFAVLSGESTVLPDTQQRLTLALAPLQEEQVERLMSQALDPGSDSWPHLVATVTEASGGRPFHLEQVVRLLAEGGTEVDATLADILTMRTGRLPTDALRLLQAVCVYGTEARQPDVEALYGDPDLLPQALTLLTRRGLLVRREPDLLQVPHTTMAEAVRASMPADARRELHRQALSHLSATLGDCAICQARHASEAHLGEEALQLLRDAGKQAEQWLDDVGAARYYQQALRVARWELLYEENRAECLELSVALVDTLRFSGDPHSAELVLKEALRAAGSQPGLHARLLRSQARLQLDQGDDAAGIDTMREAVRHAIFAGDPNLLCELYIDLGRVLLDRQQFEVAAEELTEGVAMVTGGDGADADKAPATFWRLLNHLAESQLAAGQARPALLSASSALGQARQGESLIGQARSHFLLARVFGRLQRNGASDEHHAAAVAAFRRLGDRRSTAECLLDQAAQRPADRTRLLQEALELSRQVNWAAGIAAAQNGASGPI